MIKYGFLRRDNLKNNPKADSAVRKIDNNLAKISLTQAIPHYSR
jgi:hypothetical protein